MAARHTSVDDTTWVDLLRHGEPAGGSYFRGSTDDPLTDRGWAQARTAAADGDWDLILSSDLQRCLRFAETLAEERRLPLTVDARFREMHFGDWEALRADDIPDRAALQAFWADPDGHTPPGGESVPTLITRVNTALDQILERHRGQRILLVSHAGVIHAVIARTLGINMAAAMRGFHIPHACRTRLRVDRGPQGDMRCICHHGAPG
ncbi:MAG: alpha-ribazole phosphatase family protein [Ectothiorhodospiraceae bacterium]|nr:alpha-ribazole phosphatase family protein [Ectothiorhodospiraceae bacterium]